MRLRPRIDFVVAAALLLLGCESQPPVATVSLEDAKRIAIDLSEVSAVPPRTLTGISPLSLDLDEATTPPARVVYLPPVSADDVDRYMAQFQKLSGNRWAYLASRAGIAWQQGNVLDAITFQKKVIALIEYPRDRGLQLATLSTYFSALGDFATSEQLLEQARLTAFDAAGPEHCRLDSSIQLYIAEGAAALARGAYDDASQHFRRAEKSYARLSSGRYRNARTCVFSITGSFFAMQIQLGQAQAFRGQGRLLEAETKAREGLTLGGDAKLFALSELSRIMFEQGRYLDALQVGLGALKLMNEQAYPLNATPRLSAMSGVARSLTGLGRWRDAVSVYEKLQADIGPERALWEQRYANDPGRGLAYLKAGDEETALHALASAHETLHSRLGPSNYAYLEARAFYAMALSRTGRPQRARNIIREVMPELLLRWRESGGESIRPTGRIARLRLVAEEYFELLLDPAQGGDPSDPENVSQAFTIADAISTRGVQRALTENIGRSVAADEQTANLLRQRQELERSLNGLRFRLADAVTSDTVSQASKNSLRRSISEGEAALRTLDRRIAEVFPEYAEIVNPVPLDVRAAQTLLHSGEALLATFVGEQRTFVWVVQRDAPARVHVSGLAGAELADTVGTLRAALDPGISYIDEIPDFGLTEGYRVYSELLEPLRGNLAGIRDLAVLADGPLAQLPFSVLPIGPHRLRNDGLIFSGYRAVPWLINAYDLYSIPSVSSLRAIRSDTPRRTADRAFAGFGDPDFGGTRVSSASAVRGAGALRGLEVPLALRNAGELDVRRRSSARLEDLPRLADTAKEIQATAKAMSAVLDRDTYLGLEASERRVKEMSDAGELKRYRTISFATHGLVPGDLDGLTKPALALAQPTESDRKFGDDGLLTSDEIMTLDLDADWVVLSACNTAAADGAGAEAVSGLGRAFFFAGARSIVVSNWPVHSQATTALMSSTMGRYARGNNRAGALSGAMRELMNHGTFDGENSEPLFSYAHPLFWAPFTIIGDGAGPASGI